MVTQVTITLVEDGQTTVTYENGEKLTPAELASVMAPLLSDTLGPEPAIGDVLEIQRAMMTALN